MQDRVVKLDESSTDQLIALEKLCFAYHWTPEQFRLGLRDGAYTVLGIFDNGDLAAYIAFSLIEDEMEILNLAVHPDFRRQGMGAALLERAFGICREKGIAKSFLDVKESNQSALNLYIKFGYTQIGVRKKYYPDTRENALLFRYDFR